MAVKTSELSKKIVKGAIADLLKDDISSYRTRSDSDAPLVCTSFPEQNTKYPHVVVEEFDDTGGPIDRRLDYLVHDYQVQVSVYARSDTEMYNIRDEVRSIIMTNHTTLAEDHGYFDLDITSSSPKDWEQDSKVKSWGVTVGGNVFSV